MKINLSFFILFSLYSNPSHFHTLFEESYFVEEFPGPISGSFDTYTAERSTRISAIISCTNRFRGDQRFIGFEVCKIMENIYQCKACCSWKKLGKEKSNADEDSCSYFQLVNDDRKGYVNVAREKSTIMSSTRHHNSNKFVSKYAVDGVDVCPTGAGYLAHTSIEQTPWLRIDLQKMYDILSVLTYTRQDCCAKGFKNAMVTVSNDVKNSTCGFYPGPTNLSDVILVLCESHTRGRYITITVHPEPGSYTTLEICEVKIYGKRL